MPTISYDGQAFILDGRRTWLVSGAIHYARIPRGLWRSRIRAAKQAGLNCIETYVFWNLHEAAPGEFNFTDEADLRHFVQLIGEEGLYCIIRPGPYICAEWDFGGFPAWLQRIPDIKLREANGPFLAASARYLGAVLDQIADLQYTAPREPGVAPGPIVMMQAENEWFSHNPDQGDSYLREIVRYLRENGCEVPINICNNLWQRVDGTIDTWNANQHLAFDLRQLRIVQPDAPCIVTEFWPGWFDQWGREHHTANDADWNLYRLAQILSSGAMYNLYMFHGGTNFGFFGGRTVASPDCFMTTSYDYDAPLLEAGGRGPKYLAVKRISTFASQFGQLFANLDSKSHHAAIAPDSPNHPLSIVQQHGMQGTVVFILKSESEKAKQTNVLLPSGLNLPVPLGDDRAVWFLLNANLAGLAELTYTNLRPWAFHGKRMLVLFGPAGSEGIISIDDSPWTIQVPTGQTPVVETHENITVVVLNHEQVDAAYLTPQGLVVGASGLDEANNPIPLKGWANLTHVALNGKTATQPAAPIRKASAPSLNTWHQADLDAFLDGTAPSFKPISGPASLETLGVNLGYAWYRIDLGKNGTAAGKLLAPEAADRIHLFSKAKPLGVLGLGPGAAFEPVSLKLGGTVIGLADNLGRFNYGWAMGESKGIFGDLLHVEPVKAGKPKINDAVSPDPFTLKGFVLNARRGERRPSSELIWTFKSTGKLPVVLDLRGLPGRAIVYINGKPIGMYDQGLSAGFLRKVLRPEVDIKAGNNDLKIALFDKVGADQDLTSAVTLMEAKSVATRDAKWSFAPWSAPAAEAFVPLKGDLAKVPRWYRAGFKVRNADEPLWLEPRGLTKGQLFLNGKNVGRYFVATEDGKAVPPQAHYYLPEPWLRTDGLNELLIFDEHGAAPDAARLVYNARGPYGKA